MPEISIGVIGGSGVYDFSELIEQRTVSTPFGDVEVNIVDVFGRSVAFICRHGKAHKVPPHKINYRALISAMSILGVRSILATNAVGGIAKNCSPGTFILPDQLIDYTWGREHTFVDVISEDLSHVDFTEPFDSGLRRVLESVLKNKNEPFVSEGVYGCVQGPRLETAAEVQRYKLDGCSIVGMTGMPEAALAREKKLAYASICFSVNWAAGLCGPVSIDDVFRQIESCAAKLKLVLTDSISEIS